MEYSSEKCIVMRKGLDVIGSRWKLIIIASLRNGKKRYGEIKRLIPEISEKMLINELKSLVNFGLVDKKSYLEIPPKVEYSLSEKGKDILPIIDIVVEWSEKHFYAE